MSKSKSSSARYSKAFRKAGPRDRPSSIGLALHPYLLNTKTPACPQCVFSNVSSLAKVELPHRQEFGYPPFGLQARIIVRSESENKSEQMANEISKQILLAAEKLKCVVNLVGPAPAPVEKLRGKYRFHMLLNANEKDVLQKRFA